MGTVRVRVGAAATLAALLVAAVASAGQSVLRVTVTSDAGERRGACALVHRTVQSRTATLYFVTAATLFYRADGTHAQLHGVVIDGLGARVEVATDEVSLPTGRAVDVAVLRATAAVTLASALTPLPIAFETPDAGDPFTIVGPPGAIDHIVEHTRFASTLLVVGDRNASELEACAGAPALDGGRLFGIVSDCRPQRAPMVSLLSLAREFLIERIPGLALPQETVDRL